MRNVLLVSLACLFLFSCNDSTSSQTTDNLSDVSYAIGNDISKNLSQNEIKLDLDVFIQGIKDGYTGKSKYTDEELNSILTNFRMALLKEKEDERKVLAQDNLQTAKDYLNINGQKDNVVTTDSGLQYRVLIDGSGNKPKLDDSVSVHYVGKLSNGTVFDSSYDREAPVSFELNRVIPGWTEALQLMPVGSKWELYIPPNLAYGEFGSGDVIPPNSLLIFEVELLDIVNN